MRVKQRKIESLAEGAGVHKDTKIKVVAVDEKQEIADRYVKYFIQYLLSLGVDSPTVKKALKAELQKNEK